MSELCVDSIAAEGQAQLVGAVTVSAGAGITLTQTGQDIEIAATEFAPTDIANLAAWWDAADAATITDAGGGAVSAWADKSGNGNHATQGTAGSRPTTGTRTINGLNALDFDGTADFMVSALTASNNTTTVFVVNLPDSVAGSARSMLGASAGSGYCLRLNLTTGVIQLERQGAAALQTAPAESVATAYIAWATTTAAASRAARSLEWVNSAQSTTAPGLTAGRTAEIGSIAGGTSLFWDGLLAEIIVYSTTLNEADIGYVLRYLSDKWGITN